MFIKIIFALMLMISLGYAMVAVDHDNPPAERFARLEVDNMRGFVFSVNRFVGANHNFSGTVSWDGGGGSTALRDQPSTPSSLRGVAMPPGWRAVVDNGDYLLCTTMSEAAFAILGAELPEVLRNEVVKASSGKNTVVFSLPADFKSTGGASTFAEEWANTCTS